MTDTSLRLRAGRRNRCRIPPSPDPVRTPIMHEQTSADDQTPARTGPSRASSERPHDVSAAMHKAGAAGLGRRLGTRRRRRRVLVSFPGRVPSGWLCVSGRTCLIR